MPSPTLRVISTQNYHFFDILFESNQSHPELFSKYKILILLEQLFRAISYSILEDEWTTNTLDYLEASSRNRNYSNYVCVWVMWSSEKHFRRYYRAIKWHLMEANYSPTMKTNCYNGNYWAKRSNLLLNYWRIGGR